MLLDQRPETLHALTSGGDVGEDDIEDRVLRQTILHERIVLQHLLAAEDTLRGAHADTLAIEAGTAPLAVQVVGGEGGVADAALGELAAEGGLLGDELLRTILRGLKDLQILRHHASQSSERAAIIDPSSISSLPTMMVVHSEG